MKAGEHSPMLVSLRASIAVKKHHDHSHFYKVKHLTGTHLQFGNLVHCHHCGKQVSMQADVVLEKELRILIS